MFPSLIYKLRKTWPVLVVSVFLLVSGCLNLLRALVGYGRVSRVGPGPLLPFSVDEWHRLAAVVLGFGLVYLSFHLWRGRLAAWWATVGVLAVSLVIHVHQWRLLIAPACLLVLLLLVRPYCRGRLDSRSLIRGLALTMGTLVMGVLLGAAGFELLDTRDFGVDISFAAGLVRTLRQFVFLGNPDLVPFNRNARLFLDGISVLGIVAVGLALLTLLRPVAYRLVLRPQEQARAKSLLAQYGHSSYDYFKVWPDKSLFFADEQSFVAYRVHHGVAVCLGDPVGPPEALERSIEAFVRFCGDHGWVAAFLMPDETPVYRRLGLHLFKIGEEARVDLAHFCSVTSQKKYFRYVRRKFEAEGYTFARMLPPHPAELLEEIETVSASWSKELGRGEMGFVQGTLARDYLAESGLAVVRDKEGQMVAFVNEVPSQAHEEANFDLMRRRAGAHWGTMDYLFMRLMRELQADGYRWFNMGLAPFAGTGEGEDARLIEKLVGGTAHSIGWRVNPGRMRQYKTKFEPVWQERYLVYDGGPLLFPQVALAVTRIA